MSLGTSPGSVPGPTNSKCKMWLSSFPFLALTVVPLKHILLSTNCGHGAGETQNSDKESNLFVCLSDVGFHSAAQAGLELMDNPSPQSPKC